MTDDFENLGSNDGQKPDPDFEPGNPVERSRFIEDIARGLHGDVDSDDDDSIDY